MNKPQFNTTPKLTGLAAETHVRGELIFLGFPTFYIARVRELRIKIRNELAEIVTDLDNDEGQKSSGNSTATCPPSHASP